jgi:Protein of unknown function (DUF3293)
MGMNEPNFKELYENARWRADEPEGDWPRSFGVVTAWNPNGKIISNEENAERTEALRKDLDGQELRYFPVTGYALDSDHYEDGFGIECGREATIELGKKWDQLAVFWMENGWVWLIFCEPGGEEYKLRTLEEMIGG